MFSGKKVKTNFRNSRKKYSFLDRKAYYQEKAYKGKTIEQQDYAYGYLSGMEGAVDNRIGTKAEKAGNNAGLRFWNKLVNKKF